VQQNMDSTLEIFNEAKKTPIKDWNFLYGKFQEIKNKILGRKFSLSVSILNPKNAQKVNRKIRNKNYTPNTLSFKYSKTSGEIVLCPEIIAKEEYSLPHPSPLLSKEREIVHKMSKFENKITYLFIHSCIHLLDLDHGPKMDKLEVKFLNYFLSLPRRGLR